MINKIHLIIGEDRFLLKEKVKRILTKSGVNSDDLKKEIWKIEEDTFGELIKSLNMADFFQKKQLIIEIEDWSKISNTGKNNLIKVLKTTEHWVFICFIQNKKQKMNWKIPSFIEMHWITKINKSKKLKFIKEKFKKNNITYEPEILIWLLEKIPNNMQILENELEKLQAHFWHHKKVLKIKDVEFLLSNYQNENIFPLIEALLLDDKNKIAKHYLKLKKDKISDVYLLAILETYLFYLEKIVLLKEKGKTLNEIIKIIQKKIYFVINLEKLAKEIKPTKIRFLTEKMRKLEYNTKLSKLKSQILIESFFVL